MVSEIFSPSWEHLVGKTVTSKKTGYTIDGLSVPISSNSKDVLIISSADLKSNSIEFADSSFPLLAVDEIRYENQMVFAVFGPDVETLNLIESQIINNKEKYNTTIKTQTQAQDSTVCSVNRDFNNAEEIFEKAEENGLKIFRSTFSSDRTQTGSSAEQRLMAVMKNGKMHIKCASQWPENIRLNVAKELGMDPGNVVLHTTAYYSPYDQFLVQPSMIAVLAAVAASKSGKTVEISVPMVSNRPGMKFELETATDCNGKIVAHSAKAVADMGAFPVLAEEYCRNMIAGLTPPYGIGALKINTVIKRSNTFPGFSFSDMGYGMSLAATEIHFTRLAAEENIHPSVFRLGLLENISDENRLFLNRIRNNSQNTVSESMDVCIKDSNFEKQFTAYNLSSLPGLSGNPAIEEPHGAGISCGEGIYGLSSEFPGLESFSVSVTLNKGNSVLVSIPAYENTSFIRMCRAEVAAILGVKAEKVKFADINSPAATDTGPDFIGRRINNILSMITDICTEIKKKSEKDELPITVSMTEAQEADRKSMYRGNSGACVALTLHVNPVSLMPEVDNVWVTMQFGSQRLTDQTKSFMRQQVTMALQEVCPGLNGKFRTDVKLYPNKELARSIPTLLRGLVIASFITALSQACKTKINRIPVTAADIASFIPDKFREEIR